MKSFIILCVITLLFASLAGAAGQFTLVKDGKPASVIYNYTMLALEAEMNKITPYFGWNPYPVFGANGIFEWMFIYAK
jgi:hypothetical protein